MQRIQLIVSAVYPPEPVVSARLSEDIYISIKSRGLQARVLHPRPSRPSGYAFSSVERGEDEIIPDSFVCAKSSLLGRFLESISFGIATYKYIKNNHVGISSIYANTWPLFSQYYLVKAAKRYHIPCYIHIQDIYPESYCHKLHKVLGKLLYIILLPIDRYVLNNSKGVIVISPAMKEYLAQSRRLDESKFTLVRNWQDDKSFINIYKPIDKKKEKLHIMYLGSINHTANVPLIINAFSTLNDQDYRLSIIGNGPEKNSCKKLATDLGLKVSFETVMPEQVPQAQSNADVLVLCLKKGIANTATPSKLTAYMLTGRPIIASVDIDSDCANIIRESKCGIVVEPENEEALRKAFIEMSTYNLSKLNSMGRQAFEYAKSHLSKESNLKILVDTLILNNDE